MIPDTIPAKCFPYLGQENWGGATSQRSPLKWPSWVPPSASGGWILPFVLMPCSAGALNNHQGWWPRSMWYHWRPPDVCTTPCSFSQWCHKDGLHTLCQLNHGSSPFWDKVIDRLVRTILEAPPLGFGARKKFSPEMILTRLNVRPRHAST